MSGLSCKLWPQISRNVGFSIWRLFLPDLFTCPMILLNHVSLHRIGTDSLIGLNFIQIHPAGVNNDTDWAQF